MPPPPEPEPVPAPPVVLAPPPELDDVDVPPELDDVDVPPEDAELLVEVPVEVLLAVEEVVLVVGVEVVCAGVMTAPMAPPDGRVRGGAPLVSVADPPPPQAVKPPANATSDTVMASTRLPAVTAGASGAERIHSPAAHGAVVQILLGELVAPVAEAQVFDCPRQLGWGRGEWQQLGHHLELFSGLPVDVLLPGIGLNDDLTTGGGRPHSVPLTRSS